MIAWKLQSLFLAILFLTSHQQCSLYDLLLIGPSFWIALLFPYNIIEFTTLLFRSIEPVPQCMMP